MANRGVAYKDMGRLDEAARDFRHALTLLEKQSSKEYTANLLNETQTLIKARKPMTPMQYLIGENVIPDSGLSTDSAYW